MSRNAKIVLALWLLATIGLTLVSFLPALAVGQVAAGAAHVNPGAWGIVGWGALFVGTFFTSAFITAIFGIVTLMFIIIGVALFGGRHPGSPDGSGMSGEGMN